MLRIEKSRIHDQKSDTDWYKKMKMTHQDLLQGSHEGFFAGETIFPVNPFEDKTPKTQSESNSDLQDQKGCSFGDLRWFHSKRETVD